VNDIAQGRAFSLVTQLPAFLHPRSSYSSCFPWKVMGRKHVRVLDESVRAGERAGSQVSYYIIMTPGNCLLSIHG